MSPCWDIFLLSLIQVMVVATEIDTGGIPAPTITINARCLCSVCHLYHRIKLEAFTAGIAKRWKDGEGTKLEIFFRFATLPTLRILHVPLKTALTKVLSTIMIYWMISCLAIQENLPFLTTKSCPSMRPWMLLVGNITPFNWPRTLDLITRRICFLFCSNMDLFTRFGSTIQNILL